MCYSGIPDRSGATSIFSDLLQYITEGFTQVLSNLNFTNGIFNDPDFFPNLKEKHLQNDFSSGPSK